MGKDGVAPVDGPKQRLFLAVEVPRSVRAAVGVAIRPWRDAFPNARWVPPERWHVTLKFLGWTPPRLTPWVEEIVEALIGTHPRLTTSVRGLGAFPSTRRGRVLWAGIDDPANRLAALVADLETGLAEEFRVEVRRFHPHLTVARSEPPLHLPESYAATPLTSETFAADRVVLFRSHLQGGTTRYEKLRTFSLGG